MMWMSFVEAGSKRCHCDLSLVDDCGSPLGLDSREIMSPTDRVYRGYISLPMAHAVHACLLLVSEDEI